MSQGVPNFSEMSRKSKHGHILLSASFSNEGGQNKSAVESSFGCKRLHVSRHFSPYKATINNVLKDIVEFRHLIPFRTEKNASERIRDLTNVI